MIEKKSEDKTEIGDDKMQLKDEEVAIDTNEICEVIEYHSEVNKAENLIKYDDINETIHHRFSFVV